MSAAWPQVELGKLCLMEKGTSPTLKTLPGQYPLVVTADFRRSSDNWQIEGPAVCIPLISSTGHGDAALHRVHYQEGRFALANLLVALTPKDPTVCNAKYLYRLLMARKDDLLVPLMQGTANVSLKEKDISKVEVQLPPLAEQLRIVARIEVIAGKVDEAQRLRRQAMQETEALIASEKNRLFEDIRIKWPLKTLGEIAVIVSGVTLGRTLKGPAIKLPYLRVANVQDGHFKLQDIKEVDILITEKDKWLLTAGDVLLTEGGDWDKLGRGAVWQGQIKDCIHQNHIFRVRTDNSLCEPYFLSNYISSPIGKAYFQNASKQTTNLASINKTQLKALPVYLPPIKEQRRIIAYLDNLQVKVDALKRHQDETAAELSAMLPSILDKAFKGNLI